MNIHENTALLDAFADGELTVQEMADVQAHLDICPDCRRELDQILAIRAAFPGEDDLPLPAGFKENVMAAVARAPQAKPKKQPWGKLLAAAACLAVVLLVQSDFGSVTGSDARSAGSDQTTAYTADCAVPEAAPADSMEREAFAAQSADGASAAALEDQMDNSASAPNSKVAKDVEPGLADGSSYTTAATGSDAPAEDDLPEVQLTAQQVGDLLDGRTPDEIEEPGGRRCYLLTQEEFTALAAALTEQGVDLDAPGYGNGQVLVRVTDN